MCDRCGQKWKLNKETNQYEPFVPKSAKSQASCLPSPPPCTPSDFSQSAEPAGVLNPPPRTSTTASATSSVPKAKPKPKTVASRSRVRSRAPPSAEMSGTDPELVEEVGELFPEEP